VFFYALFSLNITTVQINNEISKRIIISGQVLTFVASDNAHSYIYQLLFLDTAFTAKKSYFISSDFISTSN
jgi:hypothetical protein